MKVQGEEITKEKLEKIIKNSNRIGEVLINLGLNGRGANYKRIYKLIEEFNINTSHFGRIARKRIPRIEIPINECLIKDSIYGTATIKYKIFKHKLKERKCEECGQGEIWRDKKMGLHLDHINGISNDNRLENLRILCPNCHAITDTFGGKNK